MFLIRENGGCALNLNYVIDIYVTKDDKFVIDKNNLFAIYITMDYGNELHTVNVGRFPTLKLCQEVFKRLLNCYKCGESVLDISEIYKEVEKEN